MHEDRGGRRRRPERLALLLFVGPTLRDEIDHKAGGARAASDAVGVCATRVQVPKHNASALPLPRPGADLGEASDLRRYDDECVRYAAAAPPQV